MLECENIRIGRQYLDSISWPAALQNQVYDRCYCDRWYPLSYPDTSNVAGYIYVIPRGWTRFGVFVDEGFAQHHNVWNTWLNCYHGTSIEKAKSIVEHRQLLLPDDVTMHGKKLNIRDGHIPTEHFVFTTPSIAYAQLPYYAQVYSFVSLLNLQSYNITVVLQCKQKIDSIIVQPETVGAQSRGERICPYIPNDQLEWKTKKRSAIMPYGLLLRIQQTMTVPYPIYTIPVPLLNIHANNDHISSSPNEEDLQNIKKKIMIFLFVIMPFTILALIALIFGQIYKEKCPIQPLIPVWLTVFGAAGLGSLCIVTNQFIYYLSLLTTNFS